MPLSYDADADYCRRPCFLLMLLLMLPMLITDGHAFAAASR